MSETPQFVESFPIADLKPAAYNPRHLSDDAAKMLQESIKTLGVLRPILATKDGILVAGHQRTRTMKVMGITESPAYVLPNYGIADEIRFNQLHNMSDVELIDCPITVPEGCEGRWEWVERRDVDAPGNPGHVTQRGEILRLLQKYGPFSNAVATESGRVIVGGLYASACKLLGLPLLVRYAEESAQADCLKYFGRPYGEFSYEHLASGTYNQSLAQMDRLRGGPWDKSVLYENFVLPSIKPEDRILDFGCGCGDYVHFLRKKCVSIWGLEFYPHVRGKNSIDVAKAESMIKAVLHEMEENGRFDMVIADSVLNSTNSMQAEADVMTCLHAFAKPGGTIFASGRTRERKQRRIDNTSHVTNARRTEASFLDVNGMSGVWSVNGWLFQKYHTKEQATSLAIKYIGLNAKYKLMGDGFVIFGPSESAMNDATILAAIDREFSLPLPNNGQYVWGKTAMEAWKKSRLVG